MSQFLKVNALGYHVEGGYISHSVDRFEVRISSTYEDSRDPSYKRKLLQLVLTKAELGALIDGLKRIQNSDEVPVVPALDNSDEVSLDI